MIDFEIIIPDQDVKISRTIPKDLEVSVLKGFNPILLQADFGHMLFEGIEGEGFELWKNSYIIKDQISVKGIVHEPILECTIMYENSFYIDWKNVTSLKMPNRLIQVYYAPASQSIANFPTGKRFSTIDFHFQPSILEPYAPLFPVLDQFLSKVAKKEPAYLFNSTLFASPRIEATIKALTSYRFYDELASRYYENLVHIFIIQLLECIANFSHPKRKISASDIEKAIEAKRLLTIEFENWYTINELCKILHTNPYNLKVAFRHLYGTSIGRYKKSMVMEQAKILLRDTKKTLDDISIILGYSSQQAFAAAFYNYYKIAPSQWRKRQ